jgi:hypothetical protein
MLQRLGHVLYWLGSGITMLAFVYLSVMIWALAEGQHPYVQFSAEPFKLAHR